jgi:hypothetical protein
MPSRANCTGNLPCSISETESEMTLMRAPVTVTESNTVALLDEVTQLYNFQLGVIIAGLYLLPVLIGLIGCFGAAQ